MDAVAILAILISLTPFHRDTESDQARYARLSHAAHAIAQATDSPHETALLLALGWHETRFGQAVGEGRCASLGPAWCDAGRARGYWQAWERTCPGLHALPPGDERSVYVAAECAARKLRGAATLCVRRGHDPVLGAVSLWATGHRCSGYPDAQERRRTVWRMLARLHADLLLLGRSR